jgi:hypothetical protein
VAGTPQDALPARIGFNWLFVHGAV